MLGVPSCGFVRFPDVQVTIVSVHCLQVICSDYNISFVASVGDIKNVEYSGQFSFGTCFEVVL